MIDDFDEKDNDLDVAKAYASDNGYPSKQTAEEIERSVQNVFDSFAQLGITKPRMLLDCVNFLIAWRLAEMGRFGDQASCNCVALSFLCKDIGISQGDAEEWTQRLCDLLPVAGDSENVDHDEKRSAIAGFNLLFDDSVRDCTSAYLYAHILETLTRQIGTPLPPSITKKMLEHYPGFFCNLDKEEADNEYGDEAGGGNEAGKGNKFVFNSTSNEAFFRQHEKTIKLDVFRVFDLFAKAGIGNSATLFDCINFLIVKHIDDGSKDMFETCAENALSGDSPTMEWSVFDVDRYLGLLHGNHDDHQGTENAQWVKRMHDFLFGNAKYNEAIEGFNVLLDRSDANRISGQLYDRIILETLFQRNGGFWLPLSQSITKTVIQLVENKNGDFCDPYCVYGEFFAGRDGGQGYVPLSVPFASASAYLYMHRFEHPATTHNSVRLDRHNALTKGDGSYCSIISHPPFGVNISDDDFDKSLLPESFTTRRSELLYPLLGLRLLRKGGRCGMILPIRVVESSDKTTREFRKYLIENSCVEAVIYLPQKIHKGFSHPACILLMFSKGRETDTVFFYRRDDLTQCEDFPTVLEYWKRRSNLDAVSDKSEKCFAVPRVEIEQNDYDLSFSRYHKSENVENSPQQNHSWYNKDKETVGDLVDELQTHNETVKNKIEELIEKLKHLKESSLSDISEGKIELCKLGDLAEIGKMPSVLKATKRKDNVRIITSRKIKYGSVEFEVEQFYFDLRSYKKSNAMSPERNDVLVVPDDHNDCWKCVLYDKEGGDTTVDPRILILRSIEKKIVPRYLASIFPVALQRHLKNLAEKSGQTKLIRLGVEQLSEIEIRIPSLERQLAFLAALAKIAALCYNLVEAHRFTGLLQAQLPESFLKLLCSTDDNKKS